MVTVCDSARETMADLAMAVIQDRGDAPFVWCHFLYVEYEGRTTFRQFADGSVLALDTATGKWMVPWRWDWLQGHVMLQEQIQDRMDDVHDVEGMRKGVARQVRLVARAPRGSWPHNAGNATFNSDLTCG